MSTATATRKKRKPPRDRDADMREVQALLPGVELAIRPGRPQHAQYLKLCYTESEYNARLILAQVALCGVAEVSDLRKHPYWKPQRREVRHGSRAIMVTEPATSERYDTRVPDPTRGEDHPDPWVYLKFVDVFDVSQTVPLGSQD
jgi:hypothetical protein